MEPLGCCNQAWDAWLIVVVGFSLPSNQQGNWRYRPEFWASVVIVAHDWCACSASWLVTFRCRNELHTCFFSFVLGVAKQSGTLNVFSSTAFASSSLLSAPTSECSILKTEKVTKPLSKTIWSCVCMKKHILSSFNSLTMKHRLNLLQPCATVFLKGLLQIGRAIFHKQSSRQVQHLNKICSSEEMGMGTALLFSYFELPFIGLAANSRGNTQNTSIKRHDVPTSI